MKRKLLLILSLIMAVCMSIFAVGCFGGSNSGDNEPEEPRDEQIVAVYNLYVANAQSNGQVPLTYEEWLASIKGEKGETGPQGATGQTGATGKSAYEIWLDNGFTGTEEDFLYWLKGEKEHTYSDTLSYDDNYHWYQATCGHYLTKDKTVHTFNNNECVCGYVKYSKGLTYKLNEQRTYYIVTGFGICADAEIIIPSTYNNLPVKEIGESAFKNCYGLTSIVIPDSVTSIGDYAFQNCDSLINITIPDGVTSISSYAFSNCDNLISITIPNGVTSIWNSAFSNCDNLTNIVIPNSVKNIHSNAFYNCYKLTNVYYNGTATEWSKIDFFSYNDSIEFHSTKYYYIENANNVPNDKNNYWRYVDGVPTAWETLSTLAQKYSEDMITQATINAGFMTGNFEVVVLNAEETLLNIENYIFPEGFDKTKIVAGLFVKFDVTNMGEPFTIYYNFGLQFSEEQTSNVELTYDGIETWSLDVVENNKTILFEYSIVK